MTKKVAIHPIFTFSAPTLAGAYRPAFGNGDTPHYGL